MKKKKLLFIAMMTLLIISFFTGCDENAEMENTASIQTFEKCIVLSGENRNLQIATVGVYDSMQREQIVWCELQNVEDHSPVGFVGTADFFFTGDGLECCINGETLNQEVGYTEVNVNSKENCSFFTFNTDKKMSSGTYIYEEIKIEF